MSRPRPKHSGFSAIELVVVVAIILLIAAIAVPRMLQARAKASEAAAVGNVKAIQTAESVYQSTYPDTGYANSLANLGSHGSTCETTSPTNACLIDSVLASGMKGGYIFDLLGDGNTPDLSYSLTAVPQSGNSQCSFAANQAGSVTSFTPQASAGSRAASNSPGGASGCGGS